MKKIIIALLLVMPCTLMFAQKDSSGFTVSVNGGVASPSGNFSKGNYADEKSGFAKTGGHFNISGVYHFSKNFGIGALLGYSQFGTRGTQSLANGYKEDSGTDSTTLYTKGYSNTFDALVGPYLSMPLGNKLSLELRAMGGYVHAHLAGFSVYYEDYLDNTATQKESSAGAFGFHAGAGLKYTITNGIAVMANADYFFSKPDFTITYQNFIVNSGRKLNTYKESISGINATVGLAFNLLK